MHKNIARNIKIVLLIAMSICLIFAAYLMSPTISSEAQSQGATLSAINDKGLYSDGYIATYSVGADDGEGITFTYSTNASNYPGNLLENAFDGNWNTFWEANKDQTSSFAPYVTVTFSSDATVDRIIYSTRQDAAAGKGYPTRLNILTSASAEGEDFTVAASVTSNATGSRVLISLDNPITARRIRLEFAEVNSTDKKLASAAEIIFLKPEEECVNAVRNIFADYNMLTFKNGVTKDDAKRTLNAVKETAAYAYSSEVKTIAERVLAVIDGSVVYDSDREFSTANDAANPIYRRGNIAGYARNTLKMVWMGTNRQATGIATYGSAQLTIFVDCAEGDPLPTLTFTQHLGVWSKWYKGGYTLSRGINVISVPDLYGSDYSVATNPGGPVYLVNPYTQAEQSSSVKIYIEGGYTFPIYRKGDGETQYLNRLEEYVSEYEAHPAEINDLTEIVSDNAILTVSATAAERYLIEQKLSVSKMCDDHDGYLRQLYSFAGVSFDKNDAHYDDRAQYLNVNIRIMQPYAAAYAYTEHVGIQRGSWENELFTGGGKYGWGLTHELCHMMDISERTRAEHTNNMWSQFNKCALLGESARGNFANFLAATVKDGTAYEERNAYNNYDGDAFAWWQIESRYPGFWGRFENAYRYADRKSITSACELHVYFASIAAGSDLSEYFARIGFNWGGNQFKGYAEASDAFKNAIDEAYSGGKIDRSNLKLWYGNAESYNYTAKYGNALAIYDGSTAISVKAFAVSGGVALTMPSNGDKGHLGYEILRRGEDGNYYVIGFTYGNTYLDLTEGAENASYIVRAYDRLLGCSALSEQVSAAGFAARVNGTDFRTLAEAFAAANDGDTIYLIADAAGGQIDVTKNITLKPVGDRTLYIGGTVRLFSVAKGATLTLSGDGESTLCLDGGSTSLSEALIVVSGTVNILDGVRIQNCKSSGNGGAIRVPGGALNIDGAVFYNNNGVNGGAIVSLTASSKIDIKNAQFLNNSATGYGGAIYANCTVALASALFDGNNAANGGAVSITGGGIISIDGCTFSENSASSQGGALHLDGKTSFAGDISLFSGNSASVGGAIYVASSSESRRAVISRAIFDGNSAESGSAICINGYSTLGAANSTLSVTENYSANGDIFIAQSANIGALSGNLQLKCSIFAYTPIAFGNNFDISESQMRIMFANRNDAGDTLATFANAVSDADIFAAALCGENLSVAQLTEDRLSLVVGEKMTFLVKVDGNFLSFAKSGQNIALASPENIPEGKIFVGWQVGEKLFDGDTISIEDASAFAENGVINLTAVFEDISIDDDGGNNGGNDNTDGGNNDENFIILLAVGGFAVLLVAAIIVVSVKLKRSRRK